MFPRVVSVSSVRPRRSALRAALFSVAVTSVVLTAGGRPSDLPSAHAAGGSHPHFRDGDTLVWYRSLPEAQAVARASNKLIFIESGRLHCTQCRRLVSQILPQEPVRSRLRAVAVGYADDCDEEHSPCRALLSQHLPGATMLPLVGFVTPDLRWVTGWYGSTTSAAVLQHVAVAEDRCRRTTAAPRPFVAPQPIAAPQPMTAPRPLAAPQPRVAPQPLASAQPLATPQSKVGSPPVAPPLPAPTPAFRAPTLPPPPPMDDLDLRPAHVERPRPSQPSAPVAPALPLPTAAQKPAVPNGGALISRARLAAVREEWGEVLRLQEGARGQPAAEATELAALADRANQWVARNMGDAERHADAGRPEAAARVLDLVARELSGTVHPASVDAVRGQDAMRALAQVQAASDAPTTADLLRKDAYARFRGSRWAPMFRSR